jgi:hypothetical protein
MQHLSLSECVISVTAKEIQSFTLQVTKVAQRKQGADTDSRRQRKKSLRDRERNSEQAVPRQHRRISRISQRVLTVQPFQERYHRSETIGVDAYCGAHAYTQATALSGTTAPMAGIFVTCNSCACNPM